MRFASLFTYRFLCCFVWICIQWTNIPSASAESFKISLNQANVAVQLKGQNEFVDIGTRQLPWKWDSEFRKKAGIGHFRLNFDFKPRGSDDLSTNIGQIVNADSLDVSAGVGMTAINIGNRYRFRLNAGDWQNVGWNEERTQYRSKPRWHVLPSSVLKSGANILELELRMEPANDAGLSVVELADITNSYAAYQRGNNLRHFGALVVALISTLIGGLALAMWRVSNVKLFAMAGLAEILFAIRQMAIFVDYPPIDTWIWNGFFASFFALYVGIICYVSSLLVNKYSLIISRLNAVYLWLSIPVLMTGYALGDHLFYRYWLVFMLLLSALHMVRLVFYTLRTKDINLRMFTLASGVALVLGLYDFLIIQINPEGLGKIRLSTFASLLFNVSLAVVIVRQFITIQKESIRLRLDAGIQQELAKHNERQRIMKELHDSVGSHLVGLLSMIKGGAAHKDIESLTEEALQELRIAVDAIQPVNGNLAAVLATLRHRLQPRLDAMNLKLIWRVDDLPRCQNLTPQGIQNIQRILLEVFTNIMLHAKSKTISLSATYSPDNQCVDILITDDGVGFVLNLQTMAGHGIKNMLHRADAIGAKLSFQNMSSHGTCITLSLSVL